MPVSYSIVEPQLREHYHKNNVQIFMETGNALLSPAVAQLETRNDLDDSQGRGYIIPVTTSRGGAVSNTFSAARNKSKGTGTGAAAYHTRWVVPATTKNATAHWDREAINAAKGPGELFDVMRTEIDARFAKLKHRIAITFFEAGYGRVATITAAPTASPHTVKVSASCFNRFEEGDDLVAAATVSGALRSATALTVESTDPEALTLTLSGSPVALSWASGDTLFFAGDHTDGVITEPMGLKGYLPSTAPSDTLFGVVRTGHPQVSGLRLNCSSYDLLTALMNAAKEMHRRGCVPKRVYVSIDDFANMSLDKDRVKIIEMNIGKFAIGFGAAQLLTPVGPVEILTEMMLEQGDFYMGDFTSKDYAPFLVHTGDLVEVDDFTGKALKDVDGETMYEQRWFSRLAIAFPGPGKFLRGYNVPA